MAEMSEEGVFVASHGTTTTEDGAETETRSVTFDPSAVPTGAKKRKRAELLKRMQDFIDLANKFGPVSLASGCVVMCLLCAVIAVIGAFRLCCAVLALCGDCGAFFRLCCAVLVVRPCYAAS